MTMNNITTCDEWTPAVASQQPKKRTSVADLTAKFEVICSESSNNFAFDWSDNKSESDIVSNGTRRSWTRCHSSKALHRDSVSVITAATETCFDLSLHGTAHDDDDDASFCVWHHESVDSTNFIGTSVTKSVVGLQDLFREATENMGKTVEALVEEPRSDVLIDIVGGRLDCFRRNMKTIGSWFYGRN